MLNSATLVAQKYGKTRVRVARVDRRGDRHEFIELAVDIALEGDFAAAYTTGDNGSVVPTDTMKNTVYALAEQHGIAAPEHFAVVLAKHFLERHQHVTRVSVRSEQAIWQRLDLGGNPHGHAFCGGFQDRNTCHCDANRERIELASGLTGLTLLKTTGSGFSGFPRDEYTTLQDTNDRIFATAIDATWPCRELEVDWTAARLKIRTSLLEVFAGRFSPSVQRTLFEMATAAFDACNDIDEIEITMPNRHYLSFDFGPLGLLNSNSVFVPTSEPHGSISARISRNPVRSAS